MSNKNSNSVTLDSAAIKELANILKESGLSEIEYSCADIKIRVACTVNVQHVVNSVNNSPAVDPKTTLPDKAGPKDGDVLSPMVGTAYLSQKPGDPTFVKVGDTVSEGQTLLIIEAMKVMNPIKSPRSGRIEKIYIENGVPVEFSEPLVLIS